MTISVIDIGTNTILMVTVRIEADGGLTVLGDEHAIARLGRGVDATRTILPETFDRLEAFLLRYRRIAESHRAGRIVAFGTSALRDARNREEFIEEMRRRTGIAIEVLGGREEAELTYRGALVGLGLGRAQIAVLDIGGGSTELAMGNGETIEHAMSIDVGAVRITERFFPTLPPSPQQLAAAGSWAASELERFTPLSPDMRLVGVAGTVTTLGAISMGLERFDAEELNGTTLPLESIDEAVGRLSRLTHDETAAIPQIASGRADIILGGAVILRAALQRLDTDAITVSTRGVRYGVAIREARLRPVVVIRRPPFSASP